MYLLVKSRLKYGEAIIKNTILILLIVFTSVFTHEVNQKTTKKDAFDIFGGWSIPYDDGSDENQL